MFRFPCRSTSCHCLWCWPTGPPTIVPVLSVQCNVTQTFGQSKCRRTKDSATKQVSVNHQLGMSKLDCRNLLLLLRKQLSTHSNNFSPLRMYVVPDGAWMSSPGPVPRPSLPGIGICACARVDIDKFSQLCFVRHWKVALL